MSQFIELDYYSPSDPYEKTTSRLFNISLIKNPEWDNNGKIWFDYEGEQIHAKGDIKKFKETIQL